MLHRKLQVFTEFTKMNFSRNVLQHCNTFFQVLSEPFSSAFLNSVLVTVTIPLLSDNFLAAQHFALGREKQLSFEKPNIFTN